MPGDTAEVRAVSSDPGFWLPVLCVRRATEKLRTGQIAPAKGPWIGGLTNAIACAIVWVERRRALTTMHMLAAPVHPVLPADSNEGKSHRRQDEGGAV